MMDNRVIASAAPQTYWLRSTEMAPHRDVPQRTGCRPIPPPAGYRFPLVPPITLE